MLKFITAAVILGIGASAHAQPNQEEKSCVMQITQSEGPTGVCLHFIPLHANLVPAKEVKTSRVEAEEPQLIVEEGN